MNKERLPSVIEYLIWGGVGLLAVTITTYACRGHINLNNDIDNETIGTFGDFVGGFIGTLFVIITAFLVWLTYKSQTKEQQISYEFGRDQRFEDTFFKLLQAQQELKNNMTFDTSNRLTWYKEETHRLENEIIERQHVFEFAADDFSRLYIARPGLTMPAIHVRRDQSDILAEIISGPPEEISIDEPERRIKQKYHILLGVYHRQLGHYFRHLYYILKFIERAEESEIGHSRDKDAVKKKYQFYVGTLRAQLSSSQLFLLFYNGICFPQMKELIIKYKLLKNLASEDLADEDYHSTLYGDNSLTSRRSMLN